MSIGREATEIGSTSVSARDRVSKHRRRVIETFFRRTRIKSRRKKIERNRFHSAIYLKLHLFSTRWETESLGYRVEWRGSLFRLTASSHARIAYTSVSTDTTRPLCPSPPLSNVLPQTRSKFPMKI